MDPRFNSLRFTREMFILLIEADLKKHRRNINTKNIYVLADNLPGLSEITRKIKLDKEDGKIIYFKGDKIATIHLRSENKQLIADIYNCPDEVTNTLREVYPEIKLAKQAAQDSPVAAYQKLKEYCKDQSPTLSFAEYCKKLSIYANELLSEDPSAIGHMLNRYASTVADAPVFTAFIPWFKKAKKLTEDKSLAAFNFPLREYFVEEDIPYATFNENEYNQLLPFIYVAITEESEATPAEIYTEAAKNTAKLIRVFNTVDNALEYLQRFYKRVKGRATQFIHDACLFDLPADTNWDCNLWSRIVVAHKPSTHEDLIMRIFIMAHRIEAYAKANELKLDANISLKTLEEYLKTQVFKNADKNPEAAKLFFDYGIIESLFEEYLTLKPVDDPLLIPEVTIRGEDCRPELKNYYIKKLPSEDPRCAILGSFTGCCQKLGGSGKTCAVHGITQASSGFYVLCKKMSDGREKILAQTWVRRLADNEILFDSIESQIDFRTHNSKIIDELFVTLAEKLVIEHNIQAVYVGRGNTSLSLQSLQVKGHLKLLDNYNGYSDANNNRALLTLKDYPYGNILLKKTLRKATDLAGTKKFIERLMLQSVASPEMMDIVALVLAEADNPELHAELQDYIKFIPAFINDFTHNFDFIQPETLKSYIEAGANLNWHYPNELSLLLTAIIHNNEALVKFIIEHGGNVNDTGPSGGNALHYAVAVGNLNIVNLLLEHGCDATAYDTKGNQAIYYAQDKQTRDLILQNTTLLSENKLSPGFLSGLDDIDDYRWFKRYQPSQVDNAGRTLLMHVIIARKANAKLIKALLDYGVNLHSCDTNSKNALDYAAANGDCDAAKLLIASGISTQRYCPVEMAIRNNRWAFLEWYLDTISVSLEHLALDTEDLDKLLLHKDLSIFNKLVKLGFKFEKNYLFDVNIINKETATILLKAGYSPNYCLHPHNSLLHVVCVRDEADMEFFELAAQHPEFKDAVSSTTLNNILLLLVKKNKKDLINFAIKNGAYISGNDTGYKFLQAAIEHFELADIRGYVESGVYLECKSDQPSPLATALIHGKYEVADCLLAHGADVNAGSIAPLQVVLHNPEWFAKLVAAGASISPRQPSINNSWYKHAKHLIKSLGMASADQLKHLTENYQLDLNENFLGIHLIDEAMAANDFEKFKYLLDLGINILIPYQTVCDTNLLHNLIALKMKPGTHSKLDYAKALHAKGVNIHEVIPPTGNPFIHALMFKENEIAEWLIDLNADINLITGPGDPPPIFFTILVGNVELTKKIFAQGVQLNFMDPDGMNPLALAIMSKSQKMLEFIAPRYQLNNINSKEMLITIGACLLSGNVEYLLKLLSMGVDNNILQNIKSPLFEIFNPFKKAIAAIGNDQDEIVEMGKTGDKIISCFVTDVTTCLGLLMEHGATLDSIQLEALINALVLKNKWDEVKKLIPPIELIALIINRSKIFFKAVENAQVEIIAAIIATGADLNTLDENYHSLLNVAISNKKPRNALLLLDNNIAIRPTHFASVTMLCQIISCGYDEVLKKILSKERTFISTPQIDCHQAELASAISDALKNGKVDVIYLLLSSGFKPPRQSCTELMSYANAYEDKQLLSLLRIKQLIDIPYGKMFDKVGNALMLKNCDQDESINRCVML